jgi:hypothetical protein
MLGWSCEGKGSSWAAVNLPCPVVGFPLSSHRTGGVRDLGRYTEPAIKLAWKSGIERTRWNEANTSHWFLYCASARLREEILGTRTYRLDYFFG